jgi:hypothetical protein
MRRLASRIEEALSTHILTARTIQDALSGAFSSRVRVKPWVDGTLRALVPADALVASGLTVVESAVGAGLPVISGTARAVENAERRVAKRASPDGLWAAKLVDFDAVNRRAIFEVTRAVPEAT